MAKQIDELPVAGALTGAELAPLQQNGGTVQGTVQDIANLNGTPFATDIVVNGMIVGIGTANIATNIVLGPSPMFSANTTGSNNTAIGPLTLNSNQTGNGNIAIGISAVQTNIIGNDNIGIGRESVTSTTGSQNIGIGYRAGRNISTGSSNICIGQRVIVPTTTSSGQLNIGNVLYGLGMYQGVAAFGSAAPTSDGALGVGISAPTARLHLRAGSATASTAPLKFTSGTNLTAVENGAVEFDGTNYFVSSGGERYTLVRTLTGTAAPLTTPAAVGIQFVDTVNDKVYVATGTASAADWTILN